jgi:predicted GIY-YIG superfamily endonuclease
MARRQRRPVETTVTSKWVAGGSGTLRDAFPLSPPVKLLTDGIIYATKNIIPTLIVLLFIYTLLKYNLISAIFHTVLAILLVSIVKLTIKQLTTTTNIMRLKARHEPTVPLDKSHSPKSAIHLLTSVLIGGLPGKGKSNAIWLILDQLNKFNIPYELYVADPKGGIELSELKDSPNTIRYIDNPNEVETLIDAVHHDMTTRFEQMKALKIRKIPFPTDEFPLRILIIDELLLCKSQIKEGALSPLGNILTSGRASSTIVLANTQLGQKTTLGDLRDLFPQRICFGTRTSDATDSILGDGATKSGAYAHMLTAPGMGFVYIEKRADYVFFKSPEITDPQQVAQFNALAPIINIPTNTQPLPVVPTTPNTDGSERRKAKKRKAAVYRLFAYDDALLYVGKANNPSDRINQHKNQPWWEDVVHSKTIITWYPTTQDAHAAELYAIQTERPIYNIQGNQDTTSEYTAGDL